MLKKIMHTVFTINNIEHYCFLFVYGIRCAHERFGSLNLTASQTQTKAHALHTRLDNKHLCIIDAERTEYVLYKYMFTFTPYERNCDRQRTP